MISTTGAYRIGTIEPQRVTEPRDAAELASVLREAGEAGEAAIVFGGGTLQRTSNVPVRYDVAIGTQHLNAVHDYDPRDLTIGIGAGMTLSALQRILSEHRQFVPLDAPFPSRATIGGTLSAGWAGPRRAAYGRPRDLLIGATVALADGTLATSGGMVVKNVTGYDMAKLYVGSHGTLGAFVRTNFKVLPAPTARRLAIAPFDDEVRRRVDGHLATLAFEPVALLIADGFGEIAHSGARVIALLEGSDEVVERSTRELRSVLGAAGVAETRLFDGADAARAFQSVLDAYAAPGGPASATSVACGLPSEAARRSDAVRAAVRGAETIADLRTGDVIARAGDGELSAVRDVLGHATVLCAGDRASVEAWGEPPATLTTMRALKERFDPRGTLAPGRFLGGI